MEMYTPDGNRWNSGRKGSDFAVSGAAGARYFGMVRDLSG